MFSFSPDQGLVEYILNYISWNYGWKLCGKKKKLCLTKGWAKLPKVKKKRKKKEKSVPLCSQDFMLKKLEIKRS